MNKKKVFDMASTVLDSRKYYHGTKREISGDYLMPRETFNSLQDGMVSGAFVTSDINLAKFFAINSCIGMGQTKSIDNKIYLERLADHIRPEFYIYTVYETPDNPFIHDNETEYYSTKPIKIAEKQKCNTAQEIEKLGFEIYVLNEPLENKVNMESGNNLPVRAEMDNAIKQNKFHRVDIAKMIEQQSQYVFQKISRHDGKE